MHKSAKKNVKAVQKWTSLELCISILDLHIEFEQEPQFEVLRRTLMAGLCEDMRSGTSPSRCQMQGFDPPIADSLFPAPRPPRNMLQPRTSSRIYRVSAGMPMPIVPGFVSPKRPPARFGAFIRRVSNFGTPTIRYISLLPFHLSVRNEASFIHFNGVNWSEFLCDALLLPY
jgi:hypothetical protein